MTTTRYVPPIPTTEMVTISREALAVLSLVELTSNSHRLLATLLAYQDPDDGCADLSQAEMGSLLGLSAPSVNRAVKQLADKNLAWLLEPGAYQIHPLLTGGRCGLGWPGCPGSTPSTPSSSANGCGNVTKANSPTLASARSGRDLRRPSRPGRLRWLCWEGQTTTTRDSGLALPTEPDREVGAAAWQSTALWSVPCGRQGAVWPTRPRSGCMTDDHDRPSQALDAGLSTQSSKPLSVPRSSVSLNNGPEVSP